ncbi:MAG: hypothetical protein ABFS21_11890, partial [Actinomycetota bacterium]
EEGIELGPNIQAAGLDAARASLGLVNRLQLDDLPRSRGFWMLGAHLLTADHHTEALEAFAYAVQLAVRADAEADAKLAMAFGALTELAAGRDGADERLAHALDDLGSVEQGADFVAQVTTARRVLGL